MYKKFSDGVFGWLIHQRDFVSCKDMIVFYTKQILKAAPVCI